MLVYHNGDNPSPIDIEKKFFLPSKSKLVFLNADDVEIRAKSLCTAKPTASPTFAVSLTWPPLFLSVHDPQEAFCERILDFSDLVARDKKTCFTSLVKAERIQFSQTRVRWLFLSVIQSLLGQS